MTQSNKEKLYLELIETHEEYELLLGEELDELATMASLHGWTSTRIKEGQLLREKMYNLNKMLGIIEKI